VEKISFKAQQKKSIRPLASLMGNLGFTKISYLNETLVVEKVFGYDLKGKPELDYRITLAPSEILLEYEIIKGKNKRARLLSVLPVFLNVLQIVEDYYDIKPSTIYYEINEALAEALKLVGKDMIELSTELSEMKSKYRVLKAKYDDLLQSSEANARVLIECENKRDELRKKVERLMAYDDETLKEMLYEWIKLHGGKLNVMEFSKINRVPVPRVEEGINMLITEGYIKRRFE
ncbi:MAG: hypothetical protein QXF70_00680, partial [Candidatus Bilamarchaeaceae archaeon]